VQLLPCTVLISYFPLLPRITRRRHQLLVAVLLLLATTACTPFRVNAQTSYCLPTDHNQTLTRDWVVRLITAPTGTAAGTERDSLRLPAATASDVTIVTDSKTCERAGMALSGAVVLGSTTARRVHVIKVLDRFVVYDPLFKAGEFAHGAIVDSRGRLLEFYVN
jgi:hypothetical protein